MQLKWNKNSDVIVSNNSKKSDFVRKNWDSNSKSRKIADLFVIRSDQFTKDLFHNKYNIDEKLKISI